MESPGSHSKDMARYRGAVEEFFTARVPRRSTAQRSYGTGSDEIAILDDRTRTEEAVHLAHARHWCAELFDAGYAWIDGSAHLGGGGLSEAHVKVFHDVEAGFDTPRLDLLVPSRRVVAPGIAATADRSLAAELVPALLRADLVACQLFSEPGAGSDLSAISTRAEPEGNRWRVNGQKVWSSGAHFSDIGLLIARTDPHSQRHAGLSAFIIDMRQVGVTIRPIEQMCGGAHFNEVFLDDAVVEDRARLGVVGDGWRIAMATLAGERQSVAVSTDNSTMAVVLRLMELARHRLDDSPASAVLRDRVMDAYTRARVAELLVEHQVDQARREGKPSSAASIGKLLRSQILRLAVDTAGDILAEDAIADTGRWDSFVWGKAMLQIPGVSIGGGTDEIQRNIVAERVLGLPKDPR